MRFKSKWPRKEKAEDIEMDLPQNLSRIANNVSVQEISIEDYNIGVPEVLYDALV
jgi:hypothetical protein